MSDDRLAAKLRILVGITSFGRGNDRYLSQLLQEYKSMSFETDLVVFSNIQKHLEHQAELVVGLPSKNPWSLPFAHKKVFAERVDAYDLFIYSEDDTLLTERNIRAFLEATNALPHDKIPGFLRYELGPDGTRNYPEVHGRFHWDPASVKSAGSYTFAFFSNEHAACYVLTRAQLKQLVASGNFVRPPREGKFDLACSAGTDPYTQGGFQKVICISHLEDFLVHHLPNKYAGTTFGITEPEFNVQLGVLFRLKDNAGHDVSLQLAESALRDGLFAKNYYEPQSPELLSLIPEKAKSVLSLGCGWGQMEAALKMRGTRVKAIPIDSVIGGVAEGRGIELVYGDLKSARRKLAGEFFDVLLISNILHLVPNPVQVLEEYKQLLAEKGVLIARFPNLSPVRVVWRNLMNKNGFAAGKSFEKSGVHLVTERRIRRWFREAGLKVTKIHRHLETRAKQLSKYSLRSVDSVLASEITVIASRVEETR